MIQKHVSFRPFPYKKYSLTKRNALHLLQIVVFIDTVEQKAKKKANDQ